MLATPYPSHQTIMSCIACMLSMYLTCAGRITEGHWAKPQSVMMMNAASIGLSAFEGAFDVVQTRETAVSCPVTPYCRFIILYLTLEATPLVSMLPFSRYSTSKCPKIGGKFSLKGDMRKRGQFLNGKWASKWEQPCWEYPLEAMKPATFGLLLCRLFFHCHSISFF